MKKLFLLLAAAFVFVACNDDELDMEYYSQLTPDELITTGEGIEYLVKAHGDINRNVLNDYFLTHTLTSTHLYWKEKDGWYRPKYMTGGTGPVYSFLIDNTTTRVCYGSANFRPLKDGTLVDKFYRDLPFEGEPVKAVIDRHVVEPYQIVAHLDKIVVIQYEDDYGRETRKVLVVKDNRQEVLETHWCNIDTAEFLW